MEKKIKNAALRFFDAEFEKLTDRERRVVQHIVEGKHISRSTNKEFDDKLSFGQRLADRVAGFGGSWPFIIIFLVVLMLWVGINSFLLTRAFDPFPFILLNLFLSMLAAIQAPIIMMSQNRVSLKDRLKASQDYETNLKAELEIRVLTEKIDQLCQQQWLELMTLQQEQIQLLTQLQTGRPITGT